MYEVVFSNQAELDRKTKKLLDILKVKPLQNPPPYEKLRGDLSGMYSRRINITHRLVYKIVKKQVIVLRMWSHYSD